MDIIGHRHPSTKSLPTYIRGTKRLDYAIITPELESAVNRCGYLPFHSHFRSDHRFLYLDFDTTVLFGSPTVSMPLHTLREFSSKDTTLVVKYLKAKYDYLHHRNFFPRLTSLCSAAEADHDLAERLDRLWVTASFHAARQCRSRRRAWWSIPLNRAIEKKDLLRTCVTCFRTGTDLYSVLQDRMHLSGIQLPIPQSLEEANAALRVAQHEIKEIRKHSKSFRDQSMADQARDLAAGGNKDQATILAQMRKKELQADRWKRIKFLQGKGNHGKFSTVEVPSSWPSTEAGFLHQAIENPKVCTNWKTVDDPADMEFYLQMRNRRHFGQAQGTPFTISPLLEDVDWGATTPSSDRILAGDYPPQCDEILDELLQSIRQTDNDPAVIEPKLTMPELLARIRIWDERTTTSPSGLHLGHLKALTARVPQTTNADPTVSSPSEIQQSLQQAQLDLINYSLKHGYSYDRWKDVVNVMIEKEQGNHRIHRLRIIHLYEADLGACYAILWKKLFAKAEANHAINPGQYGGRQGHEASYLPYAEELKTEICRMSRKALINFDNDAQSCYDRIVPSSASLIARSLGMHPNITKMHADTLKRARYRLKTSLGVSSSSYSHTPAFPIYGTGQGSTNSPVSWSIISSKLYDVHNRKAHGASFCTLDRTTQVQSSITGFVDDSNCQTNDFDAVPQPDPVDLAYLATEDADLWSQEPFSFRRPPQPPQMQLPLPALPLPPQWKAIHGERRGGSCH